MTRYTRMLLKLNSGIEDVIFSGVNMIIAVLFYIRYSIVGDSWATAWLAIWFIWILVMGLHVASVGMHRRLRNGVFILKHPE